MVRDMASRYDVERFWAGYHRMKSALETVDAMEGAVGSAARAAALQVLAGGTWPGDLPREALPAVMELSAGLDRAERATRGACSEGGNPGSPTDAKTDEGMLAELVREWTLRLGRRP